MSESDKTRMLEARSRITKFTLDNKHLTNTIERLKKEIQIAEENKAKLLTDLQSSVGPQFEEERENNKTSSQETGLDNSFLTHSPINISDISDSITSSTDSDSVLKEEISNSTASRLDYSPTRNLETPEIGSSQNVLECVNYVESLLSNLKTVKKCLRTNHCLDCTQLRNSINSLQDKNFHRRQPPNTDSLTSLTASLYYIFSSITLPFLFVLMCGYLGVVAYAKQANSYIASTPPQ